MNNLRLLIFLGLTLWMHPACLDNGEENRSIFGDSTKDMPDSTELDATDTCKENEYVSNGACLACDEGFTNPPGDDPQGMNTTCEQDPCFQAFGVECAQFDEAYIKASSPQNGDFFGCAVALHQDTLVVGANAQNSNAKGINQDQEDESASESGAVYVFIRDNGQWKQQAFIKASNTNGDDYFGGAVTLYKDTLAVGAIGESSNATGINANGQDNNEAPNSGAVYVFTRSNNRWSQQAYIKASNTDEDDNFGQSLSLHQDTLAVGAVGEGGDSNGINNDQSTNEKGSSGAVYIFTRSNAEWSQQAYIKASNTDIGDLFGHSVVVDHDTLAVGAYGESSGSIEIGGSQEDEPGHVDSGAVYVFTRSNAEWSQQAYIKASNTDENDSFGHAIALDSDTLVVGAYGESSSATGIGGTQDNDPDHEISGAVYVFTRSGTAWSQEAYIKASNTNEGDSFGYALALDSNTLAVGAYFEGSNAKGINEDETNNDARASGATYVFTRSDTTWSQQAYLKSSNTSKNQFFGTSLALDGGILAIGADGESSNAKGINNDQNNISLAKSGAVYIRRLTP